VSEVAADRARLSLVRVGGADELAHRGDRVLALDHERPPDLRRSRRGRASPGRLRLGPRRRPGHAQPPDGPAYQVIEITITDHSPAAGQWERLPDRLGVDPGQHAESAAILAEVRRVVDAELTAHQRRTFVAVMVDGIPLDALAARLSLQRNAIYKVIFDARRKIRWALVANGYLEDPGLEQ
jgi:RNA polymerase sigma-70 factor (ECF subfamily)